MLVWPCTEAAPIGKTHSQLVFALLTLMISNVQPTRIYNVPHTMNDGEEGKAVALCDAHRRGWAAFTGNTGFQEPIDDRHGHGGHRGHGRSRHDDYNDYEPSHR